MLFSIQVTFVGPNQLLFPSERPACIGELKDGWGSGAGALDSQEAAEAAAGASNGNLFVPDHGVMIDNKISIDPNTTDDYSKLIDYCQVWECCPQVKHY